MTYKEAEEYKSKYEYLIGHPYHLPDNPNKILYLIIAPKNKSHSDRENVLSRSLGMEGNEVALREMGFINENLDVYISWQDGNRRYQYPLQNYLSETGQL